MLTEFGLCYTMKENVKIRKIQNFVHMVYLLAKLCNIFDEAVFIDVSICRGYLLF